MVHKKSVNVTEQMWPSVTGGAPLKGVGEHGVLPVSVKFEIMSKKEVFKSRRELLGSEL